MFRLLGFTGVRPSGAGKHRVNRKSRFRKTEQCPRSETAAPAASFDKPLTDGACAPLLNDSTDGLRRTTALGRALGCGLVLALAACGTVSLAVGWRWPGLAGDGLAAGDPLARSRVDLGPRRRLGCRRQGLGPLRWQCLVQVRRGWRKRSGDRGAPASCPVGQRARRSVGGGSAQPSCPLGWHEMDGVGRLRHGRVRLRCGLGHGSQRRLGFRRTHSAYGNCPAATSRSRRACRTLSSATTTMLSASRARRSASTTSMFVVAPAW